MSFLPSITHFLLGFDRLTIQLTPQAVTTAVAGKLFQLLQPVRVTVWLQTQPVGIPFAHSSSGQLLQGESRLEFSRPLQLRGQSFGHLRVEFLAPDGALSSALPALETLAKLLALYGERLHLEQTNASLRRRLDQANETLAADKLVARAAGQISKRRHISQSAAEQWIRSEGVRRGRSAASIAEEIVDTTRQVRPGLPTGHRALKRREVAA